MDRLELTVSATVIWASDPRRVIVDIVARNRGDGEALLLDRLWTSDRKGVRAWDPEGAYRFADKGSLRLLFGPAPIAPNTSWADPMWPHLTRLAPGDEVARRLDLAAPIEEYSALFLPLDPSTGSYTPARVDHIDVLMRYALPVDGVKTRPSFIDPKVPALAASPGVMRTAHTRIATPPFEVLRRTDEVERVKLPGEP
jgi:hypothetical protein